MPTGGADPVLAGAKRKVIEIDHVLDIPGDSMVMADHGIATASITGKPFVMEVDAADDRHYQVAIGHAIQRRVVSARFEHDLHR